jgi:Family of unknown function (DUF6463)
MSDRTPMSTTLPWILFALGIGHVIYGCIKFRAPLREAVASGFVSKFSAPEARRTAFWFVMFGPLLMLAGQVAVHAASAGDAYLVRLVGFYLFGVSAVGACALPKSPFLAGLAISVLLLGLGHGFI